MSTPSLPPLPSSRDKEALKANPLWKWALRKMVERRQMLLESCPPSWEAEMEKRGQVRECNTILQGDFLDEIVVFARQEHDNARRTD